MPQTILTFSAADEGRNFKRFSQKMLRCEARAFPVGTAIHDKSAIFYSAENVYAFESGHVASGHLFLGEAFFASSIIAYWPLAVSMPPTKVCPQCKAVVPVRRKTCERCDLVFRFK